MVGCGESEDVILDVFDSTEDATWQIGIVDGEPIAIFEGGNPIQGWDAYRAEVEKRIGTLDIEDFSSQDVSLSIEQLNGIAASPQMKVWGYYIRFSAESGYLGGCIGRKVPHLGILISRQGVSQPLVNIHLAAWTEAGRVCAGIYNSGSNRYFCAKICSPTYSEIRNAIAAAIVVAGVGYLMAEVIATVIAPIAYILVF